MTLEEYHIRSEDISDKVTWSTIVSTEDTIRSDYDPDKIIDRIKIALNKGNRVTFGMLIAPKIGHIGATGRHKSNLLCDTWMLSPKLKQVIFQNFKNTSGHEMLITGYDTEMTVRDPSGYQEKGVFRVRNSWGPWAGYKGDYWVTENYLKAMLIEAHEIIPIGFD